MIGDAMSRQVGGKKCGQGWFKWILDFGLVWGLRPSLVLPFSPTALLRSLC